MSRGLTMHLGLVNRLEALGEILYPDELSPIGLKIIELIVQEERQHNVNAQVEEDRS
jgi:hypothetical protein